MPVYSASGMIAVWLSVLMVDFHCRMAHREVIQSPRLRVSRRLGVRTGRTTTVLVYGDNLAPKSIKIEKSSCTAKLMAAKATDDKTKTKGANVVEY